jgi:hypothetical protein
MSSWGIWHTCIGNYQHAIMKLTNLGIELSYDLGVLVSYLGCLVRHGIEVKNGDHIVWAWFLQDSIHNYAHTPRPDYARYHLATSMNISWPSTTRLISPSMAHYRHTIPKYSLQYLIPSENKQGRGRSISKRVDRKWDISMYRPISTHIMENETLLDLIYMCWISNSYTLKPIRLCCRLFPCLQLNHIDGEKNKSIHW